jgi:7,8-dihydropterin-6-yl-methyl-4-(beta-D-ribofuranosyl)aminobenzene 5'-phosphate synthase
MGTPAVWRIACLIFALLLLTIGPSLPPASSAPSAEPNHLTLTILFDNYPFDPRLTRAWGYAVLIQGLPETILFDTGGSGTILLHNMEALGIDPRQIPVIFLSHAHGDHVDGLTELLPRTRGVTVYLLQSFPRDLKERIRRAGGTVREIRDSGRIADGVYTTGELGIAIREQALVIESAAGLIIVTGCAHPGVVTIVAAVRAMLDRKVALVMGGFHLMDASAGEIETIIARLKALGVQRVGPSHCTGDVARRLLREAYGDDFVEVGVGRVITMERETAR